MQGHPHKPIENTLPVPELLARAEQGDADCQYWAGVRYFQGDGVPEDPRRAIDYCAMAAEQGDARASAFLAFCYFRGIVLPKNQRNSAKWYRLSAQAGYAPAQHTLGNFYLAGKVVRKNVRLALKWLNRAAAQNDADALVKLGDLYHEGKEVVEDDEKACGYYRQAADLGSPAGQYMYGSFLMKGEAVEANPIAALELLDLAVAQGYEPAKDVWAHFEEFVHFDPQEAGLASFPVSHPFPVRRRTAVYVTALKLPCFQALARDLRDYIKENPKDEEVGLKDVAALLAAATEKGELILPLFT